MAATFYPPAFRGAASDLTVSVSPLGLVELADEEFEVHGPRMNRYASNWAWYLGHHWAYKREIGEPQLVFNWVRAFADYLAQFTFGKGLNFHSPEATAAIVPYSLKEVWEVHNNKQAILAEIGQLGGVSGDVFVKVAYEEPYMDPAGIPQEGKIRILPLNPAFCLPVEDTEILTDSGWKNAYEVKVGDQALSLDPVTDEMRWVDVEAVNLFDWDGPMARWKNERFDALSTPDHRWITQSGRGVRSIRTTADLNDRAGGGSGALIVAGGTPMCFSPIAKHPDDIVEAVGWFVTEGHWHKSGVPMFTQSEEINPVSAARIDRLAKMWGGSAYRYVGKATQWYIPTLREAMHSIVGDGKSLLPKFLMELTYEQARMLYEVLIDGDGHRGDTTTWSQSNESRVDGFQMLAMMLGLRTQARWRQRDIGQPCSDVTVYSNRTLNLQNLDRNWEHYTGKVWCPTTASGTWVARRKGTTFHTGNCFPEFHPHDRSRLIRFKLKYKFWGTAQDGSRMVMTYVELMTEETIEEYINDELIDARPNPLGRIPIAFCTNIPVASSPWGLADITDLVALNREYNEKATEISDIINYHVAPVTVITGAKASNLEKGPRKVWAINNKDANITQLELQTNFTGPLGYMELLKQAMHELTGVPAQALGTMQPISNTSGVALSIQYQPLMMKYERKKTQYTPLFETINELVMKHAFLFAPGLCVYNPMLSSTELKPDQYPQLDPNDPISYRTYVDWPAPMPMDRLIKINEIQAMMAMNLESRKGALRDLGYAFPDQKMREIFEEVMEDTKQQGALDLIRGQIASFTMMATGMTPDGQPMMGADAEGNPVPMLGQVDPAMAQELQWMAYGPHPPERSDFDEQTD